MYIYNKITLYAFSLCAHILMLIFSRSSYVVLKLSSFFFLFRKTKSMYWRQKLNQKLQQEFFVLIMRLVNTQ